MAFVDETGVFVKGGRGGNGAATLHSEPYKPLGGPDGGNGGPGGSVIFEVSRRARDLSWLAEHPHQAAADGVGGQKAKRDGAAGKDLVITVPDGTVIYDERGLLADLVGEGSRAVVARGGRGGRGNVSLASARDRVPRRAEAGESGDDRRLRVELHTVADVGLVGLPNAGKSTLLGRLTAARPKIANYPFTTLTPNLGVAGADDDRFIVADIPGLIEGASEGRGLGHRFLRHIVRCRALVLVVDLSAPDPSADLQILRRELGAYDPALARRPAVVVGTKADLVDEPEPPEPGALVVSAVTGEGTEELASRLGLLAARAAADSPPRSPHVVLRPGRPRFTISREAAGFRVTGRDVERWVLEADMDDQDEVQRLQKRLIREGVERQLAAAGARRGDEVLIADRAFEFLPAAERS
ncbi:MAG: GTPase ObgE [Actinomycetota bacterium]